MAWTSTPPLLFDGFPHAVALWGWLLPGPVSGTPAPPRDTAICAAVLPLPYCFETSGLTCGVWPLSDDVQVAQLYDAFSPLIPLSLEGYGFCKRGEGGPFTDDGNIEWPKGRLPVNTSGGGMSEAYVHGFNLILEGARQIRGTSTAQVEGADVSLVTSGEGVPTSAILFTKEG